MFSVQLGRTHNARSLHVHPAWLLVPLGVAGCLFIGLTQGYFQSTTLALLVLGTGLAVAWVGVVLVKPEWALLFYTLMAVNLNGVDLPFSVGEIRFSPDIVLTSLLIVGIFLRLLANRRPLTGLPISAPYLIFLAVPMITLIWSPVKVESIRGIFRFVGYYALMWLIVDVIRTRRQVKHMVVALMLSPVIAILVGFYQAFTGAGQTVWAGALLNRIYGLAGGPFTLAFYLVLIMPLLLVFLLAERDPSAAGLPPVTSGEDGPAWEQWRFSRLFLLGLLGACAAALALTFIRGAWIALVVSLLVLGALRSSARFRQLMITIPVLGGMALLTFAPLLQRLTQVVDPDSTFFGRLEVWKLAWEWILSNPLNLLAGVGMKAFEYYYILLAGPTSAGLYWRREQFLIGNRPHNEIIGMWLDVGLIGVIALVASVVILIRTGWRVYHRASDDPLRMVGLAFLVSATGMFVGAMGDNVFSQPTVAVYFWIMGGLVMAIDRHLMGDGDGAEDAGHLPVIG